MKPSKVITPALPKEFKYDKKTQTLMVLYTDGKRVRYFDIHPNSAFLDGVNKERDFMQYLQHNNPKSEVING